MKLSVVTVTYNCEESIKKTIESLLEQTNNNFEFIIVDGDSSDNTMKEIIKLRKRIDKANIRFKNISEKDKGIYDAMNKSLKLVSGEWILFLNSGDLLADKYVVEKILKNLDDKNDIIYGDTLIYYNESQYQLLKPYDLKNLKKRMCFIHQSAIIKKSVLYNNQFDSKLRLVSDWKFFLGCYLDNKSFKYIPMTISKFALDGVSALNGDQVSKEIISVLREKEILDYKLYLYHSIKIIFNSILKKLPLRILNTIRFMKEFFNQLVRR